LTSTSPIKSEARRLDRISAAIIVAAAFALRAWLFGDPLIHVDENFYLLVGDRMLHGALPYVDIWDRKPVGLFLLYAAIRLLGGDGIVQYQVVAALFAAGTGLVIARIAAPMAGRGPATVAAILYLLLLGLVGGAGGQAPVFYNLFVAGAAWAVASVLTGEAASPDLIRRRGALAMGLIGLGMQIKYTVVFEGVFFGLALMWASWKASRSYTRLAIDMTLWVVLALAPTFLALGWYVVLGHEEAFVYANFLSIGARGGADGWELLHRLSKTWRVLQLPLLAILLAAILAPWRSFPRGAATFRFVLAWLGAAVVGYLIFGTYFDHYALPLFAPLAAATAPLFAYRRRHLGLIAAGVMLLAGTSAYGVVVRKMKLKRGGQAEMTAMVQAIKPRLTNCLYVWNGDPMLYHLTGSCLPTRYPFAGHLNLLRENGAIGIDQATEVRRILAAKPNVIVDRQPTARDFNFAVVAIVEAELRQNYRPVAIVPLRRTKTIIYERKPGH
jgi:4-amino-4-deoxy-L-arabinose transferase-like glycosyltransferase